MKKAVKILIFLILGIALFSARAAAAESVTDGDQILTERNGEYVLSVYSGGVPKELASGTLNTVLSALSGGNVLIDGVSVSESFEFPKGEYTLSGSLSVTGDSVISLSSGTSLNMSKFTLTFAAESSGYLRIKGGAVTMRDSYVHGGSSGAVRLDYSSASALTLISTGITSVSTSPTINLEQGSLHLSGGYVKNTAGPALESDSMTYLSGAPEISGVGFDIIAGKPLYLSDGGVAYSGGDLRISYTSEFETGTMSELLYSATAEAVGRIELYDVTGREYELTYFETCPHSDEKSFGAVYLPYAVKIYDGATLLSTEYKLRGETVTEPTPNEKLGYSFLGWYKDRGGEGKYDFTAKVNGNTDIYAVYSLKAPNFSVSSLEFTYDAKEHKLGFNTLEHPLDDEGGFYSYKWFKDGKLLSTAAELGVKNVSDSGTYSCIVTYNYSSDTAQITADGIKVKIEKRSVTPAEITPLYYTGKAQSPDIPASSLYSYKCESGTDAGSYPISFTLLDRENYRFVGTDDTTLNRTYVILKADNSWSEEFSITDAYFGAEVEFSAMPKFGTVKIMFSLSVDGEYSETPPDAVGTYYARASVEGCENYSGLLSAPARFSILVERVVDIEVKSKPEKTEYIAMSGFSPLGLTLLATYDSGRTETVGADRVSFTYQNGSTFTYGDTAVNLSFGGISLAFPVTVTRASYDISGIIFVGASVVYNGRYQSLSYTGSLPVGLDGIPLTAEVSGGGVGAGSYTVTLTFDTESPNYEIPASKTATITVERARVTLEWANTEFTYDGVAKLPTASYTDVFGVKRTPTLKGEAASAGSYTATAGAETNYTFDNPDCAFVINRADYDFSGVFWKGGGYVYDGTEKSVSIDGLPEGVSALGYTDSRAIGAGSYTATAALSYDTKNYNPPPALTYEWRIEPAEYDLSLFEFTGGEFVFDGKAHYPAFSGTLPVGADGIALEYYFSAGVTHVDDSGEVTVNFKSESTNYKLPQSRSYTVTVTPKPISVVWSELSHTYTGTLFVPKATAAECKITVMGGKVNAGEYTATANPDSADYHILNPEMSFVIEKAENGWSVALSCNKIYEGRTPQPNAVPIYGEAEYAYYFDAELKNEASPVAPGTYYVVASVPESENYLPLSSTPVSFEIVAVVPVSLSVALTGGITAYRPLTDSDVVATAVYNDGSSRVIPFTDISVDYQNDVSPRVGDTALEFGWSGFIVSIPVTVSRASYDLSGLMWQNTNAVYDGSEKHAVLTGLPEGVTVKEYVGNGQVNSGEYTVYAVLSYDEINFLPPEAPAAILTVRRAELPIPVLGESVYNGGILHPSVVSPLYTITYGEIKDAGTYTVSISLSDTTNYCFAGGASIAETSFTVLPRSITVTVEDVKVYFGEDIPTAIYSFTSGEIAEGDSLSFTQYEENGRLLLRCNNENYELTVLGGSIERIDRLSPDTEKRIILYVIVAILVIIAIVALYVTRDRIKTAIAVIKCRYANRRTGTPASASAGGKQDEEVAAIKTRPVPTLKKSHVSKARPPIPMPIPKVSEKPQENTPEDSSVPTENTTINETVTENVVPTHKTEEPKHDSQETENSTAFNMEEPISDEHTSAMPRIATDDEPSDVGTAVQIEELATASIDVTHADELITDSLAKDLVKRGREIVFTDGSERGIINIDTLSKNFTNGDRVDVNILKQKSLVPYDTAYLKVLARGEIDKALSVYANDFSLSAIKMLVLTGGEAVRVTTIREKRRTEEE